MNLLTLAVGILVGGVPTPRVAPLVAFPIRVPMRIEIPLKAPPGWKVDEQDRATVLTPADVPEGKVYQVMVTVSEPKAGSLDEILEAGKKMIAEVGTFSAKVDPAKSTSAGGWDYVAVVGIVAQAERSLVVSLVAFKKGDQGGVVVVLADSVETTARYQDAFARMIREMGAKPLSDAGKPGATRLEFRAPPGWVETKVEGQPYLVKEKNEQWVKYRMSLLVLPGEARAGGFREQFDQLWRAYVAPNFATRIVPLPLMSRLASGYACAFDADSQAKDKSGAEATVALYLIAHGGRVVPVMGVFSGPDWNFEKTAESEIGEFLSTARISGATAEKVALFSGAELVGDWSESSVEMANYVTAGGKYAGDATIATASYLDLHADGSYARTLHALSDGRIVREKDAGTWTVEDDELVLSKAGRIDLLGYGSDAKVGRFLVLGTYPNRKSKLKLTNPRGILQALWMKAK